MYTVELWDDNQQLPLKINRKIGRAEQPHVRFHGFLEHTGAYKGSMFDLRSEEHDATVHSAWHGRAWFYPKCSCQLVKLAGTFKKHMFCCRFWGKTAGVDASLAKFE